MSYQTRAKDVQGTPTNGGRFASHTHQVDDTITLTDPEPASSDELFARASALGNQIHDLKTARNEQLLQASIARAKEQFPDAAELRLGYRQPAGLSSSPTLGVTAIVGPDGKRREAGDGTIHTDNWQHASTAPGYFSIGLGVGMMTGLDALSKKGPDGEDLYGWDAERSETVIPLP